MLIDKNLSQDDIDSIDVLAALRARIATEAGKPAEPWLDTERDFFNEIFEELADARNYLRWLIQQLWARELLTDEIHTQILRARGNVAVAFMIVREVQKALPARRPALRDAAGDGGAAEPE